MGWCLEPGEALGDGFRRVAAEEIAKVRIGLTLREAGLDVAVHEARQGFKRLRALLRLAEPSLGKAFAVEDRRWRKAGRLLAGARDAAVLVEAFDAITAVPQAGLGKAGLARLRAGLAAGAATADPAETEVNVARVLELLDKADRKLARLRWPADGDQLAAGLRKGQRRLRKAFRKAKADPSPEPLHEWRKRVKDQAAHLRLLRRSTSEAMRARHAEEKETAELLGEEHDLWLLATRLEGQAVSAKLQPTRDKLLARIEARRADLRTEALQRGARFATRSPKVVARSLVAGWEKATVRAARSQSRRQRPSTSPER